MTTEQEKMVITKYDLMYEQRMTRVETNLENIGESIKRIDADLRWLLGVMGATSVIIIGLMAHGFKWF